MTMKEFYTQVAANVLTDEMVEFAQQKLGGLEISSRRKAEAIKEKNAEGFKLIREFFVAHGEEQALTSEIAEATDMTTSKASALLRKMAESGELIQGELRIAKKGIRKVYRMA